MARAAQGYVPVEVQRFDGGLVLTAQPDILDPSQAIDLLNVTFSERGAVRQRDGYAKLTSSALTNQPDSISPYLTSGGTKRLVVGSGNRLDVLTSFPGSSAANSTSPTASPHYFARFGGPTAEVLYIANGTDQIRKLAGTTFSTPAGLSGETGRFLAFWENRLIVARESGTTAGNNPSSVRFSDPGDPENFTANTFEDLDPGDGEAIQGMCTWRELLFVFKETKFYVFTGIGTDLAGEADPDWRRVDAGVGLAAGKAVVAGRDGVYFLDRKGVYRTTGADPTPISTNIDPFFRGDLSPFFQSNALNTSSIGTAAMAFHQERLYLAVPTGSSSTNDRMLVHDPRYGWWSVYDIPASALCNFRPSADEELVFGYATGDNHVGRHSLDYSADDMATDGTGGSAISARWRSGWMDLGNPSIKRLRETKLWGEGQVGFRLTRDFLNVGSMSTVTFGAGAADTWGDGSSSSDTWGDGSDSSDLWGPVRQINARLVRQARRGTLFSVEFAASTINNAWAIHRLSHNLADQKVPSAPQTEVSAT